MVTDRSFGGCRASEKRHLEEMVESLPRDALLLGDGNFVGCPLWSALDAAGKRFPVRVGGNVSLIEGLRPGSATDRRKDIVYAWPVTQQKRSSPLRLRLIRVGPRKSPVYLLTNVLDPASLSRRAAGVIYRLRWRLLRRPRDAEELDGERAEAIGDNYTRRRPKHARHRPHTRSTPSPLRPKPPKIRKATPKEKWIACNKHPQHDA